MRKLLGRLSILLCSAAPVFSAEYAVRLSGKVVDAAGSGVAGVTIALKDSELQATTDAAGAWNLEQLVAEVPDPTGILHLPSSAARRDASEGLFNLRGQRQGVGIGAGIYVHETSAGNLRVVARNLAKLAGEMDTLHITYQGVAAGAVPVASLTAGALSDMVLLRITPRIEPTEARASDPAEFFSLANRPFVQVDFAYDESLWRPDYLAVGNLQYPVGLPVQKSFQAALGTPANMLVVLHLQSRVQTIDFAEIADQTFGTKFSLRPTATSGLAVELTSLTEAICRVDASQVTYVTGGECTLKATQAGGIYYNAAAAVTRTFTVLPAEQTITFTAPVAPRYGTTVALEASSDSKLPVTLASATESVCTVDNGYATFVDVGTCTLSASQAGNASYTAAETVTHSFSVLKAGQTFTVEPLSLVYRGASAPLVATASSQMAVTYQSLTPGVCTVSGKDLSPVVVGTCQVLVSQAGDARYEQASTTANIPVTKMPVTLTVNGPTHHISPLNPYGFAQHVTVTPAIAGMVRYATTTPGVCTVDEKSGSVTFVRAQPLDDNDMYTPGVCGIQASLPENDSTLAAPAVAATPFNAYGIYHDTRTYTNLFDAYYKTVYLGVAGTAYKFLWMAENLRFETPTSKTSSMGIFGRYYSHDDRKTVCPATWAPIGTRIMGNGTGLESFTMVFLEGRLYPSTYGTLSWTSLSGNGWSWERNLAPTNETGFALLPNGYYDAVNQKIQDYATNAYFWNQEKDYWMYFMFPQGTGKPITNGISTIDLGSIHLTGAEMNNQYGVRCFKIPAGWMTY